MNNYKVPIHTSYDMLDFNNELLIKEYTTLYHGRHSLVKY